jgi:hypothetical protein
MLQLPKEKQYHASSPSFEVDRGLASLFCEHIKCRDVFASAKSPPQRQSNHIVETIIVCLVCSFCLAISAGI